MKLPIAFENARFMVLDKASGCLSVPSRMGKAEPRPCLADHFKERIWPVHRLDYEVSGVMLFAKDAEAHRAANTWFQERQIHKTYEGWSEGLAPPQKLQDKWCSRLLRGKRRTYESPHGDSAVTKIYFQGEAVYKANPIFLWKLEPLTGRPHQLRFELFKHGYPILGDTLYSAKRAFEKDSIALRSIRLDFTSCNDATEKYGLPAVIEVAGLARIYSEGFRG